MTLQNSSAAAAAAILLIAPHAFSLLLSLGLVPLRHPPSPPPALAAARPPPSALTTISPHHHQPSPSPSPALISAVSAVFRVREDAITGVMASSPARGMTFSGAHSLRMGSGKRHIMCLCASATPMSACPRPHAHKARAHGQPLTRNTPVCPHAPRMPARMPCTCTRHTRRPAHNTCGHLPARNTHNTPARMPACHAHPHAHNTPPRAQCISRTPHTGDPHARTPALNAPTRTRRTYLPRARTQLQRTCPRRRQGRVCTDVVGTQAWAD
ncbi:hypothetical protein OF83DRAFT_1176638 [Amylostereum chailletii]|nr:hypothetical protein OF83DRAFT_1176638 [Amylostereum chailletii]